jgi:predicted transcriptional regulator
MGNTNTEKNNVVDQLPALGELERDVMQLVWRLNRTTAETIRVELDRPLKESTVRTVLRRLEEKGYVAHKVENRTYIYHAAEARQRVAAKAVKRIVDWFCNGSMEELLVGMVDTDILNRKDLLAFAGKFSKTEKGKK